MAYRIRTVAVWGALLLWGTQSCLRNDADDAGVGHADVVAAVGGQAGVTTTGGRQVTLVPIFSDPEVCPVADGSVDTCAISFGGAPGPRSFVPEMGIAGDYEAPAYCHDFEDGLQGTTLIVRAADENQQWVAPPVGFAIPTLHLSRRQHLSGSHSLAVVFAGQPSGPRFKMQTSVLFGQDQVGGIQTAVNVLGCGPSFASNEALSIVADQFQEAEWRNPESCQSVVAAAGATHDYNKQDVELTPGAWNATQISGNGCSFELRITTWSDFVGTFYIDDVSN